MMILRYSPRGAAVLCLLAMNAAICALHGAEPIDVFILAGQSNMEGQGFIKADPKRNEGKGSLEYLTKDPATADKFKLAKMSDLQPVASQLVLGGPPECPQRPFCLLGLQST